MIKKYILWLWVWLLAFLWFTSANTFVRVWDLGFYPNYYDSNYWNSVLKRWRLLSNYLWTSKEMFSFWNQNFVFWNNWQLYLYDYLPEANRCSNHLVQWYFNMVRSCPVINDTWDFNIWNCGEWVSYSSEIIWNFLKTLKQWDWFYYDRTWANEWYCRGYWYNSYFCFSSQEIWNTLCFYVNHSPEWSGGPQPFYWLWDSLWFDNWLTYWLISNSYLELPPDYWSIDWSSQDVSQSVLTWDVMISECTKQKALIWYRANWYKSRMCYSSYWNVTDLYEWVWNVSAYELTWVSIADVWFDSAWYRRNWLTWQSMWYNEWFSYWRKTYNVYKQNPDHTNPFIWVPVSIFTLMWNIDAYWLPYNDVSVLEFCDLSLYTENYNAVYTWVASSSVCSMSSIEYLDAVVSNELNPDDWYPWYWWSSINWTVWTIWSSWDWITNRSWYHTIPWSSSWLDTYQDWLSFQNYYFNLLKDNYKFPSKTWDWIIPYYIILAFCWLIFFRFISH